MRLEVGGHGELPDSVPPPPSQLSTATPDKVWPGARGYLTKS